MKELTSSRILIVEDEPDILSVLDEHLTEQGYTTKTAATGTAAIIAVKAFLPDLILLDIMMPGMSGFDVCNILRGMAETSVTPIIFLTAITDTTRKVMGLRLGAVDFITKPFDLRELSVRVETALRTHSESAIGAGQ